MWAGLQEQRLFWGAEGLQIFAHERSKRSFQVDPLKYPICEGDVGDVVGGVSAGGVVPGSWS